MSDSDSYRSYPSDEEEMPCCPFDLDSMSSESSDENPDNNVDRRRTISIKVRKEQSDVHFVNPDTNYLEELQSRQNGECVFFPLKMKDYLSENHQRIIDGLEGLAYEQSFVYIGSSLVVSLNVDNDRIKVPKQLICDAIIFANNKPVTVLSFVKTNDKPEKYALYNSLLSRHITKITRTSLQENITVISGVVGEQDEIKERIEEFESKATLFCIPGSLEMNASRSRAAATSVLQEAADCKAAILIDSDSGKGGAVCTLSQPEFEEMTDVINDTGLRSHNSITFQNKVVALESLCRLSKLCRIRVHFQEPTEFLSEDQHTTLRKHYPKLDIGTRTQIYGTVLESNLPVARDNNSGNGEGSTSLSQHNNEPMDGLTKKILSSPHKEKLSISSANVMESPQLHQVPKSRKPARVKSMQHERITPQPGRIKRAQSMFERREFKIDAWLLT